MKLKGRVAIVTGGGRGIGKAIAIKLAEEGVHVVVASTSLEPAVQVVKEVEARGCKGLAIQTDVSKFDECKTGCRQNNRAIRADRYSGQQRGG